MTEQMTLLVELSEMPKPTKPKRKLVRPVPSAKHEETPTAQALRFRREAAEIRRELRQANTPQSPCAAQNGPGSVLAV